MSLYILYILHYFNHVWSLADFQRFSRLVHEADLTSWIFSDLQTERSYQKQPTIFQNKKRVLATDGGKEAKEKLPRYHKSVGLGFKTPREVKMNQNDC